MQGYNIAFNTEDAFFADLGKNLARAQRFADAMTLFSTDEGYSPRHLLENCAWANLGKATVVDIGGSHGVVCIALAKKFPSLHCIVQDRPETVKDGPVNVPPELAGRVTFSAHDFFTEQPIKDADVYFLRWILHDWSDKYCIRILRALIPALKKGARVILNEYVLPEPGTILAYKERDLR